MEQLQNHENEDIYKLAYEIIDQFFSSDDVRICVVVVFSVCFLFFLIVLLCCKVKNFRMILAFC